MDETVIESFIEQGLLGHGSLLQSARGRRLVGARARLRLTPE